MIETFSVKRMFSSAIQFVLIDCGRVEKQHLRLTVTFHLDFRKNFLDSVFHHRIDLFGIFFVVISYFPYL